MEEISLSLSFWIVILQLSVTVPELMLRYTGLAGIAASLGCRDVSSLSPTAIAIEVPLSLLFSGLFKHYTYINSSLKNSSLQVLDQIENYLRDEEGTSLGTF